MKRRVRKVVLAYSGGLDTSIIVPWLIERYGCEVITCTGNVGQAEELEGLEQKAKASGASKAIVEDLRPEFARDYLWPALRAGAIYEGRYLLGTALATRPFRQLSTGEQKLVLLVRALVKRPRLLILDEPFQSFDAGTVARCRDWLDANLGDDQALLFVTHHPPELPRTVTRTLRLDRGRATVA